MLKICPEMFKGHWSFVQIYTVNAKCQISASQVQTLIRELELQSHKAESFGPS